jgi:hypothetical protein
VAGAFLLWLICPLLYLHNGWYKVLEGAEGLITGMMEDQEIMGLTRSSGIFIIA